MDDKYTEDTFSGIPVLMLRERPLFPETLTTLMIARPYDLRVINWAVEHDGYFVAVLQDNDDENSMRKVGTLVKISKFIRLPNNCIHLFTTTVKRVTITSLDKTSTPYFASGETLFDKRGQAKSLQPYTRILKDLVSSMSKSGIFNFITDVNITNFDSPEAACWYASSALVSAPKEFLQELLEETDVKKRITSLTVYIGRKGDSRERGRGEEGLHRQGEEQK